MANPFVAELRLVGFNFPPKGWAFAAGQILSISQNTALFSLLGTTYGGDGKSNFALPNLQGSLALGFGQGPGLSLYDLGQTGGSPTITLLGSETPNHQHSAFAVLTAESGSAPAGNALANSGANHIYANSATLVQMSPSALSPFGGNLPHNNMMPFLTLNWVIALQGVFPPRT
jgi:microcystin-dependent protein